MKDRIEKLIRLPAKDLVPHPANWRTHPEAQAKALSGLLEEVGFAGAVLAYRSARAGGKLTVIDGHLRRDLSGVEEVPVLVLDVDDAEADKLLATFDPIGAMAGADREKLKELLERAKFENAAAMELVQFWANKNQVDLSPKAGETDPDAVPEPPEKAITRPGDLWILGNHRLLCGDSSKPEDVDRLLAGAPIHLVNTDPPYNVKVEAISGIPGGRLPIRGVPGGRGTKDSSKPKARTLEGDFISDEEFDRRLDLWFGNLGRVLLPGKSFYIWGGWTNAKNYPVPLRKHKLYWSQTIIWDKQWPFYGRKDFMLTYEWAFYGWKEGAPHRFFGPANVSDVWSVKKINPQSMIHLTEKPVELAARALQYSSLPDENVLDLFGGSGSTLIACEQYRRKAYLMEIDPLYCDVIVKRWEEFTGKRVAREGDAPARKPGRAPVKKKKRQRETETVKQ